MYKMHSQRWDDAITFIAVNVADVIPLCVSQGVIRLLILPIVGFAVA